MFNRNKLIFAAALTGLLILGFLTTSLVSYFIAHDSLIDRIAEESLPLTSDNIYSEIERDLLRSILISSLMAHDTFVRDWTIAGEQEPERIIRYLNQIQKKYETTTAFFVSERTRNYYHPSGVIKQVQEDDPADGWYFRVRDMNAPYEINIDLDTADRSRLSIFINYRVENQDGEFLGVTGIGLAISQVTDLIETYQHRYVRQIYFVDREGNLTVHGSGYTGPQRIQARTGLGPLATRILTSPSTSLTYERKNGETVYVNSRYVPELEWYLLVEQAKTATETRLLNTLIVNILIALLVTALVLFIAYFTVRGYQSRLEEMASTDKLTGAASRQVFDMIFEHVIGSAKRRGEAVALMSIDLDNFKAINDTYGHHAGDLVLERFADIVRRHIREADTLCRWGGDEFLILMTDCPIDNAVDTAERIRRTVKEWPVRLDNQELAVTTSIGVTEYRLGEGLGTLIHRSDAALYEAKRGGRDSVSVN